MKKFWCGCDQGGMLFFDSVRCNLCGRIVGYCPDRLQLFSFDLVEAPNLWKPCGDSNDSATTTQYRQALTNDSATTTQYRQCWNYHTENVCNWMVPATETDPYCRACRLNGIIPDLTPPRHREYWARLEAAKRRTLHTLFELDLWIASKREDPRHGLQFLFLADKDSGSEFTRPLAGQNPVYTGHNEGDITINLAEADEVARERTRIRLGETYRTVLGHFRHETGHYFWFTLVAANPQRHVEFRELFGDETADYQAALDAYYENGPKPDWGSNYLTAYCTMHPWEDWAETWAHYLHMVDTLETSMAFEVQMNGKRIPAVPLPQDESTAAASHHFDAMINDWMRLAVGLNALNHSMGLQDAYPFVLTNLVQTKLRFVHDLIVDEQKRNGKVTVGPPASPSAFPSPAG